MEVGRSLLLAGSFGANADAFAKGFAQKRRKRRRKTERGREKEDKRKKAEERGARVCPRTSLRLKFESRRFLSRRNESPCTRAAKVPGSRAETPSYYFYGPETSAGIIIISPGRGRARSSAPSAASTSSFSSPSTLSSSSPLPAFLATTIPCRCTLSPRSVVHCRSLFCLFPVLLSFPLPYLYEEVRSERPLNTWPLFGLEISPTTG